MTEKIELGEPEKMPNGKVRWQKSYRKNRWKSPVFDQDSRRNKAEAWSLFVIWRDTIDHQMHQQQEVSDSNHPVRKNIIDQLQDYQDLCETANLDKHARAAKSTIEKVRQLEGEI